MCQSYIQTTPCPYAGSVYDCVCVRVCVCVSRSHCTVSPLLSRKTDRDTKKYVVCGRLSLSLSLSQI